MVNCQNKALELRCLLNYKLIIYCTCNNHIDLQTNKHTCLINLYLLQMRKTSIWVQKGMSLPQTVAQVVSTGQGTLT